MIFTNEVIIPLIFVLLGAIIESIRELFFKSPSAKRRLLLILSICCVFLAGLAVAINVYSTKNQPKVEIDPPYNGEVTLEQTLEQKELNQGSFTVNGHYSNVSFDIGLGILVASTDGSGNGWYIYNANENSDGTWAANIVARYFQINKTYYYLKAIVSDPILVEHYKKSDGSIQVPDLSLLKPKTQSGQISIKVSKIIEAP
jgi:hypothetical protein